MNHLQLRNRWIALCLLVIFSTASLAAEEGVAVVVEVTGGTCEFCAYNHFEQRMVLRKGTTLKPTDEIRCLRAAQATAHFISEGGGDFTVKGEAWRLVGFAGLPDEPNKLEPRFGEEAQNFIPTTNFASLLNDVIPSSELVVKTFSPKWNGSGGTPMVTDRDAVAKLEGEGTFGAPSLDTFWAAETDAPRPTRETGGPRVGRESDLGVTDQQRELAHKFAHKKKVDNKTAVAVRRALEKNKSISATEIMVQSRKGTVTLEGTVPEATQKFKAEAVAKGVSGVASVKNRLVVKDEDPGVAGPKM